MPILVDADMLASLGRAQGVLNALIDKARDEGFEVEITGRIDEGELYYRLALVRRTFAPDPPAPDLEAI